MEEKENNKIKKKPLIDVHIAKESNNGRGSKDKIYEFKINKNMTKKQRDQSVKELEDYYYYINLLINSKKIDQETFEFVKNNPQLKKYLTEEIYFESLRNYLVHNNDNISNYTIDKIENTNDKDFKIFLKSRITNKMSKGQFAENLNYYSKQRGLTPSDMAKKLDTSLSTVSDWYNGVNLPRPDKLRDLARAFNISVSQLTGDRHGTEITGLTVYDDDDPKASVKVPVVGHIPAGIPNEAIEYIEDWEDIPESWIKNGSEYFALKINGTSMTPKYQDGDIVIFQRVSRCDSGKNCAVLIDNCEATFKKLIQTEAGIILQPLNTKEFEPIFYSNKEILEKNIKVIGIPKEIRRQAE